MKISLIGAGNVAWHLGQTLEKQGQEIREVFSRNIENAQKLSQKLRQAKAQSSLDFSQSQSELFVLAIKDDAFIEVLERLVLPQGTALVHTSGSQNLDILAKAKLKNKVEIGVFYPLQTFSKHKTVDFSIIPFCIEGENEDLAQKLFDLANTLSQKVSFVTSKQRQVLHLSAVFACNFTNHLLAVSKDILDKRAISFDLLKPLIQETLEKALQTDPKTAQTGPAKRGDFQTIEKHLDLLHDTTTYHKIYKLLSESIRL